MPAHDHIERLGLSPHPEGGHYRRCFTSPVTVETPQGPRPTMTAIHYLLERGDFSAWHRLRSSELWHWQDGGVVLVHQLTPQGELKTSPLGPGHDRTLVIEPGIWFAAELALETDFVLCCCSVSPGFDFADFELADPNGLSRQFPAHEAWIRRLSRQN